MVRTGIGLTALGALAIALASCAGSREEPARRTGASRLPEPQIVATARPLQCVPYARRISKFTIRGDAWTWWKTAAGRYARNRRPAVGSILALKRTKRLRYGHIAVVSRVVNSRKILVEHANWLNQGRIHRNLPVIDVSPNNDWSVVRVWYTPGRYLGGRRYPAYGFIHPRTAQVRRAATSDPGST